MVLIRLITLKCLEFNVRLTAAHVRSKQNGLADALSRGQMDKFYNEIARQERTINQVPDDIPSEVWPIEKIWKS